MGAETEGKMPLVTAANLAQSLSREEPCLWLPPPPHHVSALAPARCDKQLLTEELLTQPDRPEFSLITPS